MPNQLYVFGSNGEGQLGIPAADIVSTPKIAKSWPPQEKIKFVSGGDNHTIILSTTGSLHYTGDRRKGQLGFEVSEETQERLEHFRKFEGTASLVATTCETSACVIEPTDSISKTTLVTTGSNHWYELGMGSVTNFSGTQGRFKKQSLPCSVVDIAAGGWHYVVILTNGDVLGWGKSRLDQLGPRLSAQKAITKPTLIEENISFKPVKVVCGKEFTYLVSDPSSGEHCLLGRDKFGLRSSMPTNIKGWKQIGATWNAIFVLFEDGSLTAWGKDNMWKLLPEKLPLVGKMAVGSEHVLALTHEGKLISWGWGKHGNCGDLATLGDMVKNDMVSGLWNEIDIPGTIKSIGAGFCTSFVLTDVPE